MRDLILWSLEAVLLIGGPIALWHARPRFPRTVTVTLGVDIEKFQTAMRRMREAIEAFGAAAAVAAEKMHEHGKAHGWVEGKFGVHANEKRRR